MTIKNNEMSEYDHFDQNQFYNVISTCLQM